VKCGIEEQQKRTRYWGRRGERRSRENTASCATVLASCQSLSSFTTLGRTTPPLEKKGEGGKPDGSEKEGAGERDPVDHNEGLSLVG